MEKGMTVYAEEKSSYTGKVTKVTKGIFIEFSGGSAKISVDGEITYVESWMIKTEEEYLKSLIKKELNSVKIIKCNCNHSVPEENVMNSSSGTCCPKCYDMMSL